MYILFDFDGTLVDSFNCVMKKSVLLAEEFSFKKIQEHEVEKLRDLSSLDVIKFLDVPFYKIPILISKMRQHLRREMSKLTPIKGIQSVLEQLNDERFVIGILTSNSVENVENWLDINNLRHLFSFIHTESKFFSKKHLIKKTLKKYKIDRSQAIYIADETRDIDAAQKNSICSIAVTWGYNSEAALLKYDPTFIVKSPADILGLCNQLR